MQTETLKITVNKATDISSPDYETRNANARLIAAAPELLQCLENILWLESDYCHGKNEASRKLADNMKQIRATIAKAKVE